MCAGGHGRSYLQHHRYQVRCVDFGPVLNLTVSSVLSDAITMGTDGKGYLNSHSQQD